jgi:hypothetical protein
LDINRLARSHIDVKPSFYGPNGLGKVLVEIEIAPVWLPDKESEEE